MGISQTVYTQIQASKKGARLWLEGQRISDIGFEPGHKYDTFFNKENQTLELRLNPEGSKKVSQKTRYDKTISIIDICNKELSDVFGMNTHVCAKIESGRITISVHEIEKNRKSREARLLDKVSNGDTLLEGSLCTGGGISTSAITEGFNLSGINTEVHMLAEIDPRYLQVAVKNFPNVPHIHQGKIEDVQSQDVPALDILSFSLPCTGHSLAGKSKNKISIAEEHSTASTSVFGALKYIVFSNPSILISENVVQAKDSATYILLKAELARIGYNILEFILDNQQAGSIEKRKRYWFVAISKGIVFQDEMTLPVFEKIFKTVGDVVETDVNHNWFDLTYFDRRANEMAEKGNGFKKNLVNSSSTEVGTIVRNYNKRQLSNPHFVNETAMRLFTVNEHARMKMIPEHLVENLPATVGHEILGQSILYNHAKGIAMMIATALKQLVKTNVEQLKAS